MTQPLFHSSVNYLPHAPAPSDNVQTSTLDEQRDTEEAIGRVLASVPPAFIDNSSGTDLRKAEHTQFLASTFFRLPAAYVSLDASKPWLMFWTVHSLDLLGVAVDSDTKKRCVDTLLAYLSPTGGFAGGANNSHLSHLLPTYAAVCSLAIVGNASPTGGWDKLVAARQNIYDFFMSCKRRDGGFVVTTGGEVDVRGTYCLLVVATMLDIITPELVHNVDKFIAACQTYEGGFACSTWAFGAGGGRDGPVGDDTLRAAMAEAHGGYTSCSLASHFLLQSIVPREGPPLASLGATFPAPIDVASAVRWSALMQGDAGEGGGFRGRTNKLVDGCYGWWVGGGFPMLEAMVERERSGRSTPPKSGTTKIAIVEDDGDGDDAAAAGHDDGEWADEEPLGHLFNRIALQEYVLLVAQKESGAGGLRDKPGKRPDLYHTCNNLSGLSVAQHRVSHSPTKIAENVAKFDTTKGLPAVKPTTPGGGWSSEEERQRARRQAWASVLGWVEDEKSEVVVGGKDSRVNTTIPVVNILGLRLKPFVNYFYGQPEEW